MKWGMVTASIYNSHWCTSTSLLGQRNYGTVRDVDMVGVLIDAHQESMFCDL